MRAASVLAQYLSAVMVLLPVCAWAGSAITGVIEDQSGRPLDGVAVSAQSADQMFSTSVYTDAHGRYVFPHLSAGNYELWAQAVGFVTARAQLVLDGTRPATRDLALEPLADFARELSGYDWYRSLPDDSAEHRRQKQAMYVACTGCHGLDVVLQNQFSESGWSKIIGLMANSTYNGYRGELTTDQLGWEGQIIRYFQAGLAKYLAEVRGPQSPALRLRPLERPTGAAARAVFTEYYVPSQERDEPSWYYGQDWMLGPSTGMHGIVGLHDVVTDQAGIAWITQARTNFETNRSFVRLDPATGAMSSLRTVAPNGSNVYFEQVGQDSAGVIWTHDSAQWVGRLDPASERVALFALPAAMGHMVNSVAVNPSGHVFLNGLYGIVEFDPEQQDRSDVPYPGWHFWQQRTPSGNGGNTYGLTTDADGNPWWSEAYSDIVAMRDMKTGKVHEFKIRDPEYVARKALSTPADLAFYDNIGAETWARSSAEPLPYSEMPRRLSADTSGDTVWVPLWASYYLAEINIHTFKITYHRLPLVTHPYKTTVDSQHHVWLSAQDSDAAMEFTPSTQKWTTYQLPSRGCSPRHVFFDDIRRELWVPCDQANMVVRVQFRSEAELRAAEVTAQRADRPNHGLAH
jgi:streptogramin lyase